MMEVTSYGELERQTPEGEACHPLGDLCAKLRHWPMPGSPGEQVKPTWLHSSSQNIATTMWFGEWLDCGLCVVQHQQGQPWHRMRWYSLGTRCGMIYHLPPQNHTHMYVMLKKVKSTSPWYHNPHSDHWCSCQHSSQAS